MSTANECYQLTLYRANKSGYTGNISPDDFNLLFPRAEVRYYNKQYEVYGRSQRSIDTLGTFRSNPIVATVDSNGQFPSPSNMFHIDTLTAIYNGTQVEVTEVLSDRLANNLSSTYEAPSAEFPIYTEFSEYIQFYPINLSQANLIYFKKPNTTFWAYTLGGPIGLLGTITPGNTYVNGTYINVPLTGGNGNGALATIVVAGNAITTVNITTVGFNYQVGDVLSASNTNLGGAGTGFSIPVSSITDGRPVYDPANSVDPQWLDTDIDSIVYLLLMDIGVNMRDAELEQFSVNQSNTQV